MDSKKRESITETTENINKDIEQVLDGGGDLGDLDEMEKRALAMAYAKFLESHNLTPDEALDDISENDEDSEPVVETETESEEPVESAEIEEAEEPAEGVDLEATEDAAKVVSEKHEKVKMPKHTPADKNILKDSVTYEMTDEEREQVAAYLEGTASSAVGIGKLTDGYDKITDNIHSAFVDLNKRIVISWHNITSTYRQSRKTVGLAMLVVGILAAVVLVVFDAFTVYEYAYNGKVLGYVKDQEEVTDVLEIAGKRLSENSGNESEIKFTANENITFNLIQSDGKSIDDADTAVNKLVYMTDIETEVYGIFDGDQMVAVVKSSDEADELLNETKAELSEPDAGMELVSSNFTNELSVKAINVLLTSIQSREAAKETMVNGGSLEVYHIVENDESIKDIASTFGVDEGNIFNESNDSVVDNVTQGDKVCVHIAISPVSVEMVETGKMRETIEYETIKKESDDYYQGDTHVQQEGVDGVQVFTGTITKVGGEVVEREETEPIEVLTEKQDKIILIGTAERPKTAPTGTYIMPLDHHEGITSDFGWRWGRMHSGLDFGASAGEPIHAADGGKVIYSGWWYGGGLTIEVEHNNGTYTKYEHCSKILVSVGDEVYQGQTIGLVGSTGNSTGNHLHFEIHPNGGSAVDPKPYLGY